MKDHDSMKKYRKGRTSSVLGTKCTSQKKQKNNDSTMKTKRTVRRRKSVKTRENGDQGGRAGATILPSKGRHRASRDRADVVGRGQAWKGSRSPQIIGKSKDTSGHRKQGRRTTSKRHLF